MTEDRPPSELYNRIDRLAANPKLNKVSLTFQQEILWELMGYLSEPSARAATESYVHWILDRIELEMSL